MDVYTEPMPDAVWTIPTIRFFVGRVFEQPKSF
jgi:hypothetical protein